MRVLIGFVILTIFSGCSGPRPIASFTCPQRQALVGLSENEERILLNEEDVGGPLAAVMGKFDRNVRAYQIYVLQCEAGQRNAEGR